MVELGNEKLESFIKDELEAKLKALNIKDPLEIFWDYNDKLQDHQIKTIVENTDGWNTVENEIYDRNYDYICGLGTERITKVLNEYCANNKIKFIDTKEVAEEIYDNFKDYLAVDLNIKQLADRANDIPVRIVRYSNYDCINSHHFEGSYGYEKSYFGDTVDALNLNPKKVKAILKENDVKVYGRWPDKHQRNGKEFITYEDFFVEIENSTCGALLITIVGLLNISEVHNEPKTITIPKGNTVGFFSPSQGGGSMFEAELQREVKINTKPGKSEYDRWDLIIDSEYGYSIIETFGTDNEFFGKQIKLT